MSNLKVGDRVRVIKNKFHAKTIVGEVGTISEITDMYLIKGDDSYSILDDEEKSCCWHSEEELEFVESEVAPEPTQPVVTQTVSLHMQWRDTNKEILTHQCKEPRNEEYTYCSDTEPRLSVKGAGGNTYLYCSKCGFEYKYESKFNINDGGLSGETLRGLHISSINIDDTGPITLTLPSSAVFDHAGRIKFRGLDEEEDDSPVVVMGGSHNDHLLANKYALDQLTLSARYGQLGIPKRLTDEQENLRGYLDETFVTDTDTQTGSNKTINGLFGTPFGYTDMFMQEQHRLIVEATGVPTKKLYASCNIDREIIREKRQFEIASHESIRKALIKCCNITWNDNEKEGIK